jgi:hypothetical protein
MLAKQVLYHLSYTYTTNPVFCSGYFGDGVPRTIPSG